MTRCDCVHGSCIRGETECSKCYEGWTGTRCDIKEPNYRLERKDSPSNRIGITQQKQTNVPEIFVDKNVELEEDQDTSIIFTV